MFYFLFRIRINKAKLSVKKKTYETSALWGKIFPTGNRILPTIMVTMFHGFSAEQYVDTSNHHNDISNYQIDTSNL